MPEYAAQSVEKVSVTAFSVVWIGIVRPSSPVQTITNPMDVLTISFVESELDLSVSFRQLCLNQWQCRSGLSAPHPESKVMRRPKRDPAREDRIHNEAIVDVRPEEQAMSWYYYLEGKISFPFRAKCLAANAVSPLRKGEAVAVLQMAVEDQCEHDMLVQIRWQGRKMAVPLSQLSAIDPDESTARPSATGVIGSLGATASNLRTAAESSPFSMNPPNSC